jgi:hypothetical protein
MNAIDANAASLRSAATKSFNGKPKATAWHLSEVRLAVGHSRLRLAVKRRCAHPKIEDSTIEVSNILFFAHDSRVGCADSRRVPREWR